MDQILTNKLNTLIKSIKDSLTDINSSGKKGKGLEKAVKESRDIVTQVLEQQLGGVSLEEQINISQIPDDDWIITAQHIIDVINDPFVPVNRYDTYFLQLFTYLKSTDTDTLVNNMTYSLKKIEQERLDDFELLIQMLEQYKTGGDCDCGKNDFSFLNERASVLKRHCYDFLWVFKHLDDYSSKRTFCAVLMNWTDLQTEALISVRSLFKKYFEADIFSDGRNELFIDVGAHDGETIEGFVTVYGTEYQKIIAYEVSEDSISKLNGKIDELKFHDVIVLRKSVGSVKGKVAFKEEEDDVTLIRVAPKENKEEWLDAVRIDDEKETPTFIKIGATGNEKDVITGCRKTIKKHSPKLAICLHHSYSNIWRIPSMIYEIKPDYKLYMRYYGGHILPTDYVLYCKSTDKN